jgi:hypothetical protein
MHRPFSTEEFMRSTFGFMSFVLPLAFAAPAGATVILPENSTDVTLTSASVLASLGISARSTGTATVDTSGAYPVVAFPITGGVENSDGSLVIDHSGSDLDLYSTTVSVDLGNFVVDTKAAQISGDVALGGAPLGPPSIPLFDLGAGSGDFILTLTPTAASALNSAFGTRAFNTTLQIGTATTNPVAAPEPSTWVMLCAGFGALAVAASRRARNAAWAG